MLMPDAESPDLYPKAEPSVLIGIFPAAAVHVRHNAVTESEVLTAAHEQARELAEARSRELRMAAVQEEDEFDEGEREHDDLEEGELDDRPNGNVIRRPHRPKSLVLAAKPRVKEQPPLPTLTAGDSTVAGQQWPLVDEIACAIREWHAVSCACVVVADSSVCRRISLCASTACSTRWSSTSTRFSWVADNCCLRCSAATSLSESAGSAFHGWLSATSRRVLRS